MDASGDNVYVTDYYNHRVQKFGSAGNFIREWGTEGSGDGQFINAFDLVIRDMSVGPTPLNDLVYVTDGGNHRVKEFKWRLIRSP